MDKWKGKKIGILGLGLEGFSSAKFFKKHGATVIVLDKKEEKDFDPNFIDQVKDLADDFILGKNYLQDLVNFDILVRSPGIKYLIPEIQAVKEKGVEITSQTKLFFDLCPCSIIGVTGTKGKGTTAALIYEMLKKSGFSSYLGGNIGVPPLDFLEKLTPQSRVVLELSSFQLQDLHKSPHIAVVLMITSEHLDYHESFEEYLSAKRNILRFQEADDYAVINRDYLASHESDIYTEGKIFQVSIERLSTQNGCFLKDKAIWIRMQNTEWEIIETKDIALPGRHNLENVCASVMAATLSGATRKDIVSTLKTFKGLPNRLEFVSEVKGVKYYNDSFSTTPETAIAAIEAFNQPKILILGGSSKKSDFTKLGEVISKDKTIKAIIGIGEEWPKIKEKIKERTSSLILVEGAKDMHTIVRAADKIAREGDIVLLSPGCASFDMFKDYKDRGEQFKKEVMALAV